MSRGPSGWEGGGRLSWATSNGLGPGGARDHHCVNSGWVGQPCRGEVGVGDVSTRLIRMEEAGRWGGQMWTPVTEVSGLLGQPQGRRVLLALR